MGSVFGLTMDLLGFLKSIQPTMILLPIILIMERVGEAVEAALVSVPISETLVYLASVEMAMAVSVAKLVSFAPY